MGQISTQREKGFFQQLKLSVQQPGSPKEPQRTEHLFQQRCANTLVSGGGGKAWTTPEGPPFLRVYEPGTITANYDKPKCL